MRSGTPLRRERRRSRRQVAEINVVPYIDVMLVLLVIFMITAPLLRTGVDIDLPEAEANPIASEGESAEPLVLSVDADGLWYLNVGDEPDTPQSKEEVFIKVSAIMRREPSRRVMVAGDSAVPYREVVQAMASLQSAGVPMVGLMTEPPQ
jgi:biopolymer transport protein TolR